MIKTISARTFFLKCRATKRAKRIEEFVRNTSQPFPVFEFVSIRASVPLVSLIHTGSCTIMSYPVFSIIFAPTLQNVRKSMFDSYLKDITVSNYSLSPRLFFFSLSFTEIIFSFLNLQWGFTLYFIPFSMYTGNVFLAVRKLGHLMQ